jgi:hypothetical protein
MPNSTPPFEELPELTRSLRSFGSRRHAPNENPALDEAQARFFAPLLDARRTAATALTRAQVAAAFDARRIGASIDATIRAFAAERFQARPPARRAFEAELFEIVEPVSLALRALREASEALAAALTSGEQYEQQWNHWLAELRFVFRTADDRWAPLCRALEAPPYERDPESRRRRHSRQEPG